MFKSWTMYGRDVMMWMRMEMIRNVDVEERDENGCGDMEIG